MRIHQSILYIWNIKLNLTTLSELINNVEYRIENGITPIHITGVNPETVVHASRNQLMRKSVMESDLVTIDNNFIVLTLRFMGFKIPERIATPDLFDALLNLANLRKYRIYILGSQQEILEKAIIQMSSKHPDIKISGHHGYFSPEDEPKIIASIQEFKPDMFFVSMPSPYKEIFLLQNRANINAHILLGVGGAIDVKAGIVKRAPLFFRKIGLEGLHRSLQNPLNYGKRYLNFYPKFLKIVITSKKYDN
jgi:N-acetylglucosaminyldiphosphoundecaprenol N-acetyl-beta-D-mannosaminyltransferase